MTRTFHKMHGLGNDFVIFDAREDPLSIDESLARAIADRKTGVGCDQLIILEKSKVADLRRAHACEDSRDRRWPGRGF